ncbi:MAG: CBS domain-containing protein [Bacteroidales bacterium]|nr:CBS domain-containing protein [Bacteroidales bacterium]MCF8389703.1 CBS domain-containing protein [Bacteroidales bacterium]
MLAKDLMSDLVPALKTSDTGSQALAWMDIFRISHLPIVNLSEFLGLISDKDIYDLNMAEEAIGSHSLSLFSPFVFLDQHIYEVIELASRLNLSVVPVLDRKNNYLGLITLNDLVEHFADLSALKHPGGILVLEVNQNDYSLTEISQIVESNDAKILSLYISSSDSTTLMEVTLKINRTDLSSIIKTFERYEYSIKASYLKDAEEEMMYHDRYELFMKYLNI